MWWLIASSYIIVGCLFTVLVTKPRTMWMQLLHIIMFPILLVSFIIKFLALFMGLVFIDVVTDEAYENPYVKEKLLHFFMKHMMDIAKEYGDVGVENEGGDIRRT